MAKKQHSNAPPNPHSVPNREIMQRLNFLYQASSWLSSLPAIKGSGAATTQSEAPAAASTHPKGKKKQVNKAPQVTPAYLSRVYAGSMKTISQKVVVKL
jgi:ribonuclease P protein subunit RPR2